MLQARDPEEIRKRLWDRVHAWREHAGGRGRIERCDHFFTGMHYSFLNPWGEDIDGLSTLVFFTERPKELICQSSNPDIATVEPRALSGGIVRSVSIKTMRNEGTATLMLHVVGNGNSPTVSASLEVEIKQRPPVPEFESPWHGKTPRAEMETSDWPFCMPQK